MNPSQYPTQARIAAAAHINIEAVQSRVPAESYRAWLNGKSEYGTTPAAALWKLTSKDVKAMQVFNRMGWKKISELIDKAKTDRAKFEKRIGIQTTFEPNVKYSADELADLINPAGKYRREGVNGLAMTEERIADQLESDAQERAITNPERGDYDGELLCVPTEPWRI